MWPSRGHGGSARPHRDPRTRARRPRGTASSSARRRAAPGSPRRRRAPRAPRAAARRSRRRRGRPPTGTSERPRRSSARRARGRRGRMQSRTSCRRPGAGRSSARARPRTAGRATSGSAAGSSRAAPSPRSARTDAACPSSGASRRCGARGDSWRGRIYRFLSYLKSVPGWGRIAPLRTAAGRSGPDRREGKSASARQYHGTGGPCRRVTRNRGRGRVKTYKGSRRRQLGAILFVAVVGTAAALIAASASSAASPQSHPIVVTPDISTAQRYSGTPGSVTFGCQARPIDGSAGPRCYQPSQIQAAYGYSGLLASGVNGAGKTIAIIDAYANPYLAQDLSIQDSIIGMPAPPSFTQIAMPGTPTFDANDPNQVGWGEEETLDVLWAHAMAPGAAIVLVEAASNQDADI